MHQMQPEKVAHSSKCLMCLLLSGVKACACKPRKARSIRKASLCEQTWKPQQALRADEGLLGRRKDQSNPLFG